MSKNNLIEELRKRIMVLDGAMGTMIQKYNLDEKNFRGQIFSSHPVLLAGCCDVLVLTCPEIVAEIHDDYLSAGADIIKTNTFNANFMSLKKYSLEDYAFDINYTGARLAVGRRNEWYQKTGMYKYVAGCVGPGALSLSKEMVNIDENGDGDIKVGSPLYDEFVKAYRDQCLALMKGGVDVVLLETVYDIVNARAAIDGFLNASAVLFGESGRSLPLMISMTLKEDGHLYSGQTLEQAISLVSYANPISIGLNCVLGSNLLKCWLKILQEYPFFISIHPNGGLPTDTLAYSASPESFARKLGGFLKKGWLNIVGGCCGTTPEHISQISKKTKAFKPRRNIRSKFFK